MAIISLSELMPQVPGIQRFCGMMCCGSMWHSWYLLPTTPPQQEIMKSPKTQAPDMSVRITQLHTTFQLTL